MSLERSIDKGYIAHKAEAGVRLRRMQGEEVSEAHSFTHLENVAGLTQVVGRLFDFTPRELQLSLIPGYMHDLIRSSSEDHDEFNDEKASAERVDGVLRIERERGKIEITDEELNAAYYAIENHSNQPVSFQNPETRNKAPESLAERLHVAVFVADKLEANGARVIARRSSFVAGDRLSETGDWRNFGFHPKSDDYEGDELMVVALESMIRMGFKNPKDIYPDRLKPLVDPLYKIQEDFFLGVCQSANVTIDDLSKLLVFVTNEKGRSILEASGVKNPPQDAGEVAEIFKRRAGLTNEDIAMIPTDVAMSSEEAVEHFSARFKDDLDRLSAEWNPQNITSRRWHQLILDYINGNWVNDVKFEFDL